MRPGFRARSPAAFRAPMISVPRLHSAAARLRSSSKVRSASFWKVFLASSS